MFRCVHGNSYFGLLHETAKNRSQANSRCWTRLRMKYLACFWTTFGFVTKKRERLCSFLPAVTWTTSTIQFIFVSRRTDKTGKVYSFEYGNIPTVFTPNPGQKCYPRTTIRRYDPRSASQRRSATKRERIEGNYNFRCCCWQNGE